MTVEDRGLFHIVIDKGVINRHALQTLKLDRKELLSRLAKQRMTPKDVYVMLISDSGESQIIRKSEVYQNS
jgi:uncharacterized membrane protein YcaP (DUF421 family)